MNVSGVLRIVADTATSLHKTGSLGMTTLASSHPGTVTCRSCSYPTFQKNPTDGDTMTTTSQDDAARTDSSADTVGAMVSWAAAEYGSETAYIDAGRTYSYAEMEQAT